MKLLYTFGVVLMFGIQNVFSQTGWQNIDSKFRPLPPDVHVFFSDDSVAKKPNRMYYVSVPLNTKKFSFEADTSMDRRLIATDFYKKNDSPLVVINAGFFSFATNRNLNTVINDNKLLALNSQSRNEKNGRKLHVFAGTFGITNKGKADVAWTLTDSTREKIWATQIPVEPVTDNKSNIDKRDLPKPVRKHFSKWKMKTAVGGGPVLIQEGKVLIANNIEEKFSGKAIEDQHPRTAIGYTRDNNLIIFVCEGRAKNAAGLSLGQMAEIMQKLGCYEALNLDGGGSTTLLVNGKLVNHPSTMGFQRPVPSVFMVKEK